jgi:hypothetical protein
MSASAVLLTNELNVERINHEEESMRKKENHSGIDQ